MAQSLGSEETYEGKVGDGIKEVDVGAKQLKVKGSVRALAVVSTHSLGLLKQFAANFLRFNEDAEEMIYLWSWEYINNVSQVGIQIFPREIGIRFRCVCRLKRGIFAGCQ